MDGHPQTTDERQGTYSERDQAPTARRGNGQVAHRAAPLLGTASTCTALSLPPSRRAAGLDERHRRPSGRCAMRPPTCDVRHAPSVPGRWPVTGDDDGMHADGLAIEATTRRTVARVRPRLRHTLARVTPQLP